MKNIIKLTAIITILFLPGMSLLAEAPVQSTEPCLTSFFTKSLHFTGEGMRRWYEEEGGFMQVTKIPYDQLDCKSCHLKSCDQCHAKKKGAKLVFSPRKARDINTCLPCHSREGLTFKFDGERENLDVHVAGGMVCADCHWRYDIHGDGRFRPSMRHPKGVRARCETCHLQQEKESPEFDPNTVSHRVHGDKLDCAACHVKDTMACINCHFDRFLETGTRKGNFIPMKDWLLLINYEGKVTSGSAMTLVYKNKKFIAYVPYFTHSIASEGRGCQDCHGNLAVSKMKRGEKVAVVDFKNNEIVSWKGVVPVVEGKLEWAFLNMTEKGWQPVPNKGDPLVQFAAYGTPLSGEQFNKMAEEESAEKFLEEKKQKTDARE
ncbi:MAG: cytochrome c3 family protein [Deltaproteobacteria bacterium]|nr:cytochrome c3 family protein [Deltaproteobacteria bacterium]